MDINNKKDSNQKESPLLFSTSLIFDQNIDKLWIYLRDLTSDIRKVDYFERLHFIKGDNTWTPGNIYCINWIGLTRLEFKCIRTKVERNKKIIIWKVKGDIGINFYRMFSLYRITQNNKTLVKSIITRTENKNELIDVSETLNYYLNTEFNILSSISKNLNNRNDDLILYESCIINKNFIKVWEFISDLQKVCSLTTMDVKKIEFNEPNMKEGSFLKFFLENLKLFVFMKIVNIKTPKNKNCWCLTIETIGTKIDKFPKNIEFKIKKINNNQTQLSILHRFKYNMNKNFIKIFKINKQNNLKKYKKYIEEENDSKNEIIQDKFNIEKNDI
jgi:hypothetical protein